MASLRRCSSKIVWIMMQVILNLVSPYTTFLQFRSYASTIDHFPRLHPSENPDCPFQSSEGSLNDRVLNYQESFLIDHEPSIEIRALLVPCPRSYDKTLEESLSINSNETFDKDFDTSGDHEPIRNCRQKLIVTLKLTNVGKIRTEDEYIVVSHALDPITMQKSRLNNPYVIKIRREPVLQLYGLKFERIVNAEAKEQIIFNERNNYVGCNDGTDNPTCGLVFNNGVPVPFSQGFCCSCNETRQSRESKEWTGNFSSKVKTNREESANKSSNRSESRAAYDSELSSVTRTKNGIERKQGHLTYNSRKLKENNVGNNVSMIGNTDNKVNDHVKINKNETSRLKIRSNISKDSNIKRVARFVDKNDDGSDNATSPLIRTILFSAKMLTKGKIEPYMDAIQEEALRESRNAKNIESRTSFDREDFVLESPPTSKGPRLENYNKKRTKRRKKYEEDVELERKNLMDELTELEEAYDVLKKMRRKGATDCNSKKDESHSRTSKDLQKKDSKYVDNIEKNVKGSLLTKIDEKEMERDEKANENKIEGSQRCFHPRRKEKMKTMKKRRKKKKKRKKKEDREDSNSVKSTETFTSRLDEFQARSSHSASGEKIYEDQSNDIEVPKKMEFAKYLSTGNSSISGIARTTPSNDVVVRGNERTLDNTLSSFSSDSKIKKCSGSTIESSSSSSSSLDSHEGEVFDLLTRLLVPDEEISQNLEILEGTPMVNKYSESFIVDDKKDNQEEISGSRFGKSSKKSIKRGKKISRRNKKYNFSPLPSDSGNLIKSTESKSTGTTETPRNIHAYVQRPSFDFITDRNLNEPSNSSDNPFLMDENARRDSVDRRIEEKFGRISEVLKEASDEANNFSVSPRNESLTTTDEKINEFNLTETNTKVMNFNTTERRIYLPESDTRTENLNVTKTTPKTQIDFPKSNKTIENLNVTKTTPKTQIDLPESKKRLENFNVPKIRIYLPDSNKKIENFNVTKNILKIQNYIIPDHDSGVRNFNVSRNLANTERNENGARKIEHISSSNVPTTNFTAKFKGSGTRPSEKVIPHDKSSFSSNPANGAERYTNESRRPGESVDRINVGTSKNGSKEISDLIISRTHLNGTILVVADGTAGVSSPGRDGVSFLDLENSGIVLRKIDNPSRGTKPLLYKIKQRRKTFGRTRVINQTDAGRITSKFDRFDLKNGNSIFNNDQKLVNKNNNVVEIEETKPRETIFYEYDFEGESDDDDDYDDLHNLGRKSRRLLSILADVAANEKEDEGEFLEDDDSQNLEYEDYTYSRTDSSKNQNVDDGINEILYFNSMTPSKRKTHTDEKNHKNFNKDKNFHLRDDNADKYINQMSRTLAHRNNAHGSKHNKYKSKNVEKILSKKSKIVKKHVNDVPMYDLISDREAFNGAKRVKNINQARNFNFVPADSNMETSLDDSKYEQKFDQSHERKENLPSIETQNPPAYNTENDFKCDKTKSSKFEINSRKKADDLANDIDISVKGNIHVESGLKGHPISFAFVAVPEAQQDSAVTNNDSYLDTPKSDNSAGGIVKLNVIPSNEAIDQDDSESNDESMSNVVTDDLGKGEEEADSFLVNNNEDGESLERNRSLVASMRGNDRFYNDAYKYGGMGKTRDNLVAPGQRFFVFNRRLDEDDVKDIIPNEDLEAPIAEEKDDDSEDDDNDLENLTREKKEVEKDFDENESNMADEISNFIETPSNDSLPTNDNVTLLKIIPEKLFDDIPADMKNDFSNNFQPNSYGENLSSFEFPFLNNPTPMNFDSAIYYENSTDSGPSSINFPAVFETTVQANENPQELDKNATSSDITTISKITEPDAVFQRVTTPPRLSISNTEVSFSKQSENTNSTQADNDNQKAEKSRVLNQTSSTPGATTINGDSCYRLRVTVKKLNLSETTTIAPATATNNVQATTVRNIVQENETLETPSEKNSSQAQTSKIRERNASAIANFIKELQALVPSNSASSESRNEHDKSQSSVKEVIITPDDTYDSNSTKSDNLSDSKVNCDENTNSELNYNPENHLDDVTVDPDIHTPMLLSPSNDNLENLPIVVNDLTIQNTIPERNPKLLSPNSKGSFYPSSLDFSSEGEQQQSSLPSGSSTKRSFANHRRDNSDKSFLFYARQKQPAVQPSSAPKSLVKSQEGNDIDSDQGTSRRQVFVSRNKRNEMNDVFFPSLGEKITRIDDVSLKPSTSLQKVAKSQVNSRRKEKQLKKKATKKSTDFNKRKVEKRKKKMNPVEIKKLTGIRRRKKKKKKKKRKKKKKKLENQDEDLLDIPEIGTKWRLVKRNLLSVGTTESIGLNWKLDKGKDDDDLEITRRTYKELDRSRVGRVSREDDGGWKRKTKDEKKKVEDAGSTLIRRRQSRTDGKQVRGGQDCSNRDHPVDVDESKYSESAHCLRFSDLWYSVYRLEGPILDHGVSVQLYEKRSLPDGTARWEDLTPSMIRLNTFSRRYRNNDDSLAFTYRAKREPSKQFPASLNVLEDRLLVPSSVSSGKAFKVAESKGAFEEYLIVRASEISASGNECDKIGVGFKAFVEQPDRCGRLEGTCLKNQPLSYWKRDREAREAGRAGCYFLSNFASVPSEPIKYNVSGSGSGEFLALEYHSPHVSAIDIEVRNDYNGVASAGPFGRITHIYVDSTSPVHTLVTIVIRNVGSTATVYRPRIVDCPRGLPVSWSNARGIVQMILPRQNGRVAFDLYGELPFNEFECTVELLDRVGKTAATRRMKVRRMDRCFCVWHCLCACVGDADGSSCRPMSTAQYRAAGFQPPVPATPMRSSSSFLGSLLDVSLFSLSLLALLLAMGISKWIIGIYVPAVGRWGLDTLLESSRMREYFEEELKCKCIVRDEYGLPVHPDTGSRSIRICSRKVEFFLNATFFLTYPVAVFWQRLKKLFYWSRRDSCSTSNDESKACLTSDRDEYQNLVTVSTYGDCRNSKMEAEDTDYVINELKRSQESLQEYNRYKRFRYYMENQDSRY